MSSWNGRISAQRWLFVWLAATAVMLTVRLAPEQELPALTRDSFQYLSVAKQLAQGHFGQTRLVHYDAERSFGVVPAPMVTFPLGYSAAIAAVASVGVPFSMAALMVNLASALGCVALLWWCTGRLRMRPVHRHVVVGALALNAFFLKFTGMVMSEVLFMACVLTGVALLLASRLGRDEGPSWLHVAAGLAFGYACHVRYAGLFLVVGLGVVVLRHLAFGRRRLAAGYAVTTAVATAILSVGLARNLYLAGHWLGRDSAPVRHPVGTVLHESVRAADLLLLGPGDGPAQSSVPGVLFLLLLSVAAVLAVREWKAQPWPERPASRSAGFGADVALLAGTYVACMFFAGVTTNISYGVRMFVPILPLIALVAGVALSAKPPVTTVTAPRVARLALAGAFALYVALNVHSVRYPQSDSAHTVRAELDARTGDGQSIRETVRRLAGPDGVIVANNGQAVGYLLGRATVSLPGPRYSRVRWDERAVRRLVNRFGAKVVLITAPNAAQPGDDDLIPAPFVARLAHGMAPGWLHLEGRAGAMLVYVPVRDSAGALRRAPTEQHREPRASSRLHTAG